MQTIHIQRLDDDSPEFLAEVHACIDGVLIANKPAELIVINIDNWFGQKWLHFAGKALGAMGVWYYDDGLTIPPFVPARVRSESRFFHPEYRRAVALNPIHPPINSSTHALHRRVSKVAPQASLIWYSGGSQRTGRGSIMAYLYSDESYWTWYVELAESKRWGVNTAKGITAIEFSNLKNKRGLEIPKTDQAER